MKWILMAFSALIVSGCSAAGWYYGAQDERLEQCQRLPSEMQRMECEREVTKTFAEYTREREQALDEKKPPGGGS
ncbi:hypothetical protein [Pseudidiomarina salilacus]|uniref:hypothetical protein n=1 Tax=Pseudidiomarina salilacus TaxID=3384452 RepID=UPI003984B348